MCELRLLTSIELFLNAEFYKSHPVIHTTYKANTKLFQNALNMFQTFISENAYKTGKQACDLVIEESRLNCISQTWCGFLCVLALSSVTQRTINSFYPDSKVHDAIITERYTVLFNQKIQPRELSSLYSSEELNILFCYSGILPLGEVFKHNHYVPLITVSNKRKRVSDTEEVFRLPTNALSPKVISKTVNSSQTCTDTFSHKHSNPSKRSCSKTQTTILKMFAPTTSNMSVDGKMKEVSVEGNIGNELPEKVSGADKSSCTEVVSKAVFTCEANSTGLENQVPFNDVSTYFSRAKNITINEKSSFVKDVFIPDETYNFPKRNKRKFNVKWLKSHPWLCYSPAKDGAYCLPCCLFYHNNEKHTANINVLVSAPLTRWNNAATHFKHHETKSPLHLVCYQNFLTLQGYMSDKTRPIDDVINRIDAETISKNRKMLYPEWE